MLHSLYTQYQELLDETLSSNTFLVAIIAGMILCIGVFSPTYAHTTALQTNIVSSSDSQKHTPTFIEIEGETYEIILKKTH